MATAKDVVQLLRARYALPEWALVTEVSNTTGGRATRRADAVAMNLWPSRGLEVHGFEIKVRREDWLTELKNPQKADEIARYCDYWWLVVGHRDVCGGGECPASWGMLHVSSDGKSLGVAREPTKLEPVPLDRGFIGSMLRRALHQITPEAETRAAVAAAVAAERAKMEAERADRTEDVEDWYRALKSDVEAFEAASGIRIRSGRDGSAKIGERVAAYLRDPGSVARQLRSLQAQIQNLADAADSTACQAEGKPDRGVF